MIVHDHKKNDKKLIQTGKKTVIGLDHKQRVWSIIAVIVHDHTCSTCFCVVCHLFERLPGAKCLFAGRLNPGMQTSSQARCNPLEPCATVC